MKLTVKQSEIITYSGLSATLILCMLAIFGLIFSGCSLDNLTGSGRVTTEERTVAPFENVIVEGALEIHLAQGSNDPLMLEAEDNIMPVIETYVSGTTLHVKIRNNVNLKHFRPIHVYLNSESYRKILFSGSGSVRTEDTIHTDMFEYQLNGSADAQIKVDAAEVRTEINGSGRIALRGVANEYHSVINGSGNVDGEQLRSNSANIRISGSGNNTIWVLDRLDAKISGSGNIRYKGTPSIVNSDVNGSGKVIKL